MTPSVTVTITSPKVVKPLIEVGEVVRIASEKRVHLMVYKSDTSNPSEEIYSMKPVYKPSPKSTLRHKKSKFSKIKIKLINQ